MPLSVVFFGTPQMGVETLQALAASKHEVVAVVTAVDRPSGRGMQLRASPVKEAATGLGLPVLQPSSLKSPEVAQELISLDADLFVVTAYGLILPPAVLQMPSLGCLNVHFSLLPRHRGAAPVQWALIEGDDETGVTIMRMDEGMDTGDIVTSVRERILPGDTTGSLSRRLSIKGASLLVDVIDDPDGDFRGVAQDGSRATYAPKLNSSDAKLDWTLDADAIERRVRAFDPRPGAWCTLNRKRLKLWEVAVLNEDRQLPPGTLEVDGEVMRISTGSNPIECRVVQPEGGSRMSAAEFVRGHRPMTPAKLS